MSGRIKKCFELEEKIRVHENALMDAKSDNAARTHAYLLDKFTDEWCKLQESLTEAELLEMAEILGY